MQQHEKHHISLKKPDTPNVTPGKYSWSLNAYLIIIYADRARRFFFARSRVDGSGTIPVQQTMVSLSDIEQV